MKNAVSVSTNTYHGFSVDEALEGIARAGFRYVELTAVRGWTEHIMPDQDEAQLLHQPLPHRGIDPADELGCQILQLHGHGARAGDGQRTRADAARQGLRRHDGPHDGGPVRNELGCGRAALTEGRAGDLRQQRGHRARATVRAPAGAAILPLRLP